MNPSRMRSYCRIGSEKKIGKEENVNIINRI